MRKLARKQNLATVFWFGIVKFGTFYVSLDINFCLLAYWNVNLSRHGDFSELSVDYTFILYLKGRET